MILLVLYANALDKPSTNDSKVFNNCIHIHDLFHFLHTNQLMTHEATNLRMRRENRKLINKNILCVYQFNFLMINQWTNIFLRLYVSVYECECVCILTCAIVYVCFYISLVKYSILFFFTFACKWMCIYFEVCEQYLSISYLSKIYQLGYSLWSLVNCKYMSFSQPLCCITVFSLSFN